MRFLIPFLLLLSMNTFSQEPVSYQFGKILRADAEGIYKQKLLEIEEETNNLQNIITGEAKRILQEKTYFNWKITHF